MSINTEDLLISETSKHYTDNSSTDNRSSRANSSTSPRSIVKVDSIGSIEGSYVHVVGGGKGFVGRKKKMFCQFDSEKHSLVFWKSHLDISKKESFWVIPLSGTYYNLELNEVFSLRIPHLIYIITDKKEIKKNAKYWVNLIQEDGTSTKWDSNTPKTTPHFFVKQSFNRLTWCNLCEKFIWGLRRQGYECSACGWALHTKCKVQAESLQCGLQKRANSQNKLDETHRARGISLLTDREDTHPEIEGDELKLGKIIGYGSFGKVYEAYLHGKSVAVKVIEGLDIEDEDYPNFISAFKREIGVMSKCHHPNILLYMGACTSVPERLMIVLERCKVDLDTLLIRDNPLRIPNFGTLGILKMTKDVAAAMTFLHSRDPVVLHLDLKPANILLDAKGVVKVADFGETLMKGKFQTTLKLGRKGTPKYMAPGKDNFLNLYINGETNKPSDIYSFGITFYELVFQRAAYPSMSYLDLMQKTVYEDYRPEFVDTVYITPQLKEFIESCWTKNKSRRPTFPEILTKLDGIILEYAVQDENSRRFWKEICKDQNLNEVPWEDFSQHYVSEFSKSIEELEVLFLNLPDSSKPCFLMDKVVTLDDFGKALDWFGPLSNLVDQFQKISSYSYFHGDISKDEAIYKLRATGEGSFLIRLGHSTRGAFLLCYLSDTNSKELTEVEFVYQPKNRSFNYKEESFSELEHIISFFPSLTKPSLK